MRLTRASLLLLATFPLLLGCQKGGAEDLAGGVEQEEIEPVGQAVEAEDDETSELPVDLEDAALIAAVKTRLLADPRVAALAIDVGGQNGIVTLKGSAGNEEAKAAAEEVARETEGVTEVVSLIKVDAQPKKVQEDTP